MPEPEWALSERGEQQADALVPILAALGIEHVYSSPFRRCRDTLRPFAERTGVPLTIHPGLRERCLSSQWLGDFREVWERSWADFSFALEGGESSRTCRDRIAAAVADIVASAPGRTLALGSHGYSIGLLLTTLDPTYGIREAGTLRTPEIIKLVHEGDVLQWDRDFSLGAAFDQIATHFRLTPGIVA